MVGRTRLYQRTGSPLIHGAVQRRNSPWPWVLSVLLLAAVAAAAYYLFIR